jgi:hypothetical protein
LINKYLEKIEERFITKYRDDIINFNGEVSVFQPFKEELKEFFEDRFIKLKSIW